MSSLSKPFASSDAIPSKESTDNVFFLLSSGYAEVRASAFLQTTAPEESIWNEKPKRICVPVLAISSPHTPLPAWEGLCQSTGEGVRPLVEPRIQQEQCRFHPNHGMLYQLFTLTRILVAYYHVPRGSCGVSFRSKGYGVCY